MGIIKRLVWRKVRSVEGVLGLPGLLLCAWGSRSVEQDSTAGQRDRHRRTETKANTVKQRESDYRESDSESQTVSLAK